MWQPENETQAAARRRQPSCGDDKAPMIHRIEIAHRPGVRDSRGAATRESVRGFLRLPVESVTTRSVFKIDAELTDEEVEQVRLAFTDPVIQESSVGRLPAGDFDWLLTVG
ncbi:MAG: hypothetical protein COW34_07030, partial [Armatimonadetes bacterium CG17_big_fil_post_rev_8_21_14_2_50_66_6]